MKIVFFNGTADYWRYYLENATVSFDVNLVFGRRIFTKSRILKYINKLHWSDRINKLLPLPLKDIWFSKMVPIKKTYKDKVTFLIYTSYLACPPFDPKNFIRYLRDNYNCKIALMYGNTVKSEGRFFDGNMICPLADLVCSYNTEDTDKYNIKVHPTLLFDLNIPMLPLKDRETDVFFIGQEKGRGDEINRIYKTLTSSGLKCEFYIVGETEVPRLEGIHYSNWIPYSFVANRIKQTRCILNLLWEGSKGVTLRDIEAYNNGCFVLKNYVDNAVYDLLDREQVLLTDSIDGNLIEKIKQRESAFEKTGEQKSFDVFYKWIIDNSWNR